MATYKLEDGATVLLQVNRNALPGGAAANPISPTPAASSAGAAASPAVSSPAATAPAVPPAAGSTGVTAAIGAAPGPMGTAMAALVAGNDAATAKVGLETLIKIVDNIAKNPNEEKYRKIKQSNATFNRKIGGLTGGRECILALGFTDDGQGSWTLEATGPAWENLTACKAAIEPAIAALAPAPTPAAPPAPTPAPVAPMGGMGAGGMGAGGMPPGVAEMMANPQMIQVGASANFNHPFTLLPVHARPSK